MDASQYRLIFKLLLLPALLSAASTSGATHEQQPEGLQSADVSPVSAEHDFDFLYGDWQIRNRLLKQRLVNSHDWIEFTASDTFHPLPGNLGSEENYRTDHWPDFRAIGLHLYDPKNRRWTLYWADNRNSPGTMQTLAAGAFAAAVGTFYGSDEFGGKPITVRIIWKRLDPTHVYWEQSFSTDQGHSWETNWTMDFTRQ